LPIGNLTSQYFANFYLGHLDHLVKDELGVKGYVRYMNDMLFWDNEKTDLHRLKNRIQLFLHEQLQLDLKSESIGLEPVTQGISFLGFRIFPRIIRLQRTNWTRFKQKIKAQEQAFNQGVIQESALVQSVQSLLGHVQHANTLNLRRNFFYPAAT
jgi:RNA-directed DNA polymerase